MKYITTSTHPELKEGVEIKLKDATYQIRICGSIYRIGSIIKDDWLNSGYIKELQEPEFTRDETIDFGYLCLSKIDPSAYGIKGIDDEIKLTFEYWKNKRDEK